jgi:hypothetical protein
MIDGVMYQPLNPSEVHATGNQLREQCLYTPIPILLNGEQINRDVYAEKWTEITEDAFIRIESQSHRLSVFNLGVLVCHESAGLNGVGVVVVSRKALEVNFARNDVIKGKCEVWKRIRPILARYADRKDKRERRTEEWRDFKAQELLSWDGTRQKGRELSTAPVFTDLAGKHWSIESLTGNQVRQITLGMADSLKADRIHQSGVAVVLDEEKMSRRLGARSFAFLLKRLGQAQEHTSAGLAWAAQVVVKKVTSFEKLAEAITDEHFVIPPKELTVAQKTTLAALNEIQGWLASAMSHSGESVTFHRRHIYAMRSETAEAYTDGSASIHIHEKYLSGSTHGPGRGMAWLMPLTETSWSRVSRRTLALGRKACWIEPDIDRRRGVRRAGVVIDTSGSIEGELLHTFVSEINGLLVRTGCEVILVDCDAAVQQVTVHRQPIRGYVARGGGGTDFRPAINLLRRMEIDVAVYFTDLAGTFPEKKPAFPLLWAVTQDLGVPFGQKLLLPWQGGL